MPIPMVGPGGGQPAQQPGIYTTNPQPTMQTSARRGAPRMDTTGVMQNQASNFSQGLGQRMKPGGGGGAARVNPSQSFTPRGAVGTVPVRIPGPVVTQPAPIYSPNEPDVPLGTRFAGDPSMNLLEAGQRGLLVPGSIEERSFRNYTRGNPNDPGNSSGTNASGPSPGGSPDGGTGDAY